MSQAELKKKREEIFKQAEEIAADMAKIFYNKSAVAIAMAIRCHSEIMVESFPDSFDLADKFLQKDKE